MSLSLAAACGHQRVGCLHASDHASLWLRSACCSATMVMNEADQDDAWSVWGGDVALASAQSPCCSHVWPLCSRRGSPNVTLLPVAGGGHHPGDLGRGAEAGESCPPAHPRQDGAVQVSPPASIDLAGWMAMLVVQDTVCLAVCGHRKGSAGRCGHLSCNSSAV